MAAWPWRDVWGGLDRLLVGKPGRSLALVAAGLVVGWWLYVPAHELLHAAACVASGGTVERLEIAPEYGGAILANIFPFVVADSEYAGRLSGFDTGGSDLRYLVTDLGPFVLTLFPGVWLLRRAARRSWSLLWGMALPLALAPFLSITGDAYEIGSILATNLPPWSAPAEMRELVRGDDLARVLREGLPQTDGMEAGRARFVGGVALAAVLGMAWCFAVYALASWIARAAGEPLIESISDHRQQQET